MSDRIPKLNNLLQQEISTIFTRILSLKPGVFLTVSQVRTTRDLRTATVSVSIFPATEVPYAMKTLAHEHVRIQKALHSKLSMKIIPKINFVYDDTEERADVIEKIFHDLDL